ncbi:MAG: BamA/TamA family outer membrane protein [Bacteroidia bacterium]|nr:BamA/TamA family outer membrane protein [Bacteroidia bacterium]
MFVKVDTVFITGNRITKPFIILRELSFERDDTIAFTDWQSHLDRSKKNLINTSLFNFVDITWKYLNETDSGIVRSIAVTIAVRERWYTWPSPVFDVMEQNLNTWWRNGHNLDRATYGFMITRYNFRGRKETVALIARFGYSQQIGGQYSIPFIDKKRTLGVTLTALYTRNHEVFLATRNNLLVFYKDRDHHIRSDFSASMKFQYRPGIYYRQTLDLKFTDLKVNDDVISLAPDYFTDTATRMRYFSVSYQLVRDYRDARYYPLSGTYTDVEVTRHGLGLLEDENLNLTFIAGGFRKYQPVTSRIYAAGMVRFRYLPGQTPPYYHQRALGFSTYVRGYEYYVIDGQSYVLFKSSLKYQLMKPRTYNVKFLPVEKFNMFHVAIYGGIFCDGGYVQNRSTQPVHANTLADTWLYSFGAGLDFVTYYDLVFRFECAVNHLGESGYFLHMGAPF